MFDLLVSIWSKSVDLERTKNTTKMIMQIILRNNHALLTLNVFDWQIG